MLLAATGGALDSFLYLNHGHVFAAAMTGNGVLLGVAVLHYDGFQAIHHAAPILAFVFGALTAKLLSGSIKSRSVTVGLSLEIAILFGASWLPGNFPELVFIGLISMVAAYQVTSFRIADTFPYNSTFMTGNLRSAVDGIYESFRAETKETGKRKTRAFLLLVGSFMIGAVAGALLAPRWMNHTLWFIDIPLIAVLGLIRIRSKGPMSDPVPSRLK